MAKKEEFLKALNGIHNDKYEDIKKDIANQCDEDQRKALYQYNAMLDNITVGAHTKTTIEFDGIKWDLRLLTSEESIQIFQEVIEAQKASGIFEDQYALYFRCIKTLAKALTPSPFKLTGDNIITEKDLKMLPDGILYELAMRYDHFVELASRKPQDFTEEEINALIEIVKKKPQALIELDRSRLLAVSKYLLSYYVNLEKITKTERTN